MLVASSSFVVDSHHLRRGLRRALLLLPASALEEAKGSASTVRKVEVGQRAQTIGGFVGTVVKNEGDLVTLRSASGVELDFIPSAIARRYDPVVPESTDDHPSEGDAK